MKEETKQMGLMKKLTSAIVASSLVFSLVGTAAAAYTPAAGETAGKRMQDLKILTGKPDLGLDLNGQITRAELVTIIVRAFGKEADAKLLTGSTVFPDIKNHWASGNIAMAVALADKAGSDPIGMPDGTFAPDAKLTPAQAVAFLMKFVGVKADASKSWPANYLDVAVEKNLISAEDKAVIAPMLNENATRGLVFYMFDRAFSSYKLAGGGTFYTTFVDNKAPELTVNAVAATTMDSKVTITGNVKDAVELYVGTTKVTADASGNFSADVALSELKDYDITVTALDLAGNKAEKSLKVTRTTGTVDSITADAITVAAGGTAEVKVVVKDAKGNVLKDAVTGESTVGTFADGVFTAGKVTGTGTLTLKAGEKTAEVKVTINAGALDKVELSSASVAPGAKVTLTAKDANGNVVSGVTYSQTSADALVDSTNGVFIASKAGTYTVTAKAGDVTKEIKIGVYEESVASYSVTWGASQLVANNASVTTLTIKALDQFGNLVAKTAAAGSVNVTVNAGAFKYNTDGSTTFTNDLNGASSITLTNGVATLTVRTNSAVGGTTGKVTVAKSDNVAVYSSATINLVDQVATSLSVGNNDQFLASNANTNYTYYRVRVLDQDGKAMRSGYYPIKLELNSGVNASIVASGKYDYTPADSTEANVYPNFSNMTAATSTTVYYDGLGYASGGTVPAIKVSPNFSGASGTVTVAATATGLTAGSKDVTMQFAGQAAKLTVTASTSNVASPVAGTDTLTYTVKVTDAAGVPVSGAPSNVVVAFTGITNSNRAQISVGGTNPSADKFEVPVTITNGSGSFTISAAGFTGELGFVVRDNATSGALTAAAAQSVKYAPGVVASVSYTVNTVSKTVVNAPAGADAFTVVAQLKDTNGNKTAATGTLKLTATAVASTGAVDNDVVINGTAGSGSATIAADGTATFTVKPGTFVNGQYTLALSGTYTADDGSTKTFGGNGAATLPATALTLNIQNSVANSIALALYAESGRTTLVNTVDASSSANVFARATVTDAAGRKVADEGLKVYTVNSDGTTTLVARSLAAGESTLTAAELSAGVTTVTNNANGTYDFSVIAKAAPSMTFKVVTTKAVNTATSQFSVGVRPDYGTSAARGAAVAGGSSQDFTRLTEKALTINFVDAYGNNVVNNSGSAKTVTLSFGKGASYATSANVQVRTTAGGLSSNTVSIADGASSVTVYIVTDEAAGTDIQVSASITGQGTPSTAILNGK